MAVLCDEDGSPPARPSPLRRFILSESFSSFEWKQLAGNAYHKAQCMPVLLSILAFSEMRLAEFRVVTPRSLDSEPNTEAPPTGDSEFDEWLEELGNLPDSLEYDQSMLPMGLAPEVPGGHCEDTQPQDQAEPDAGGGAATSGTVVSEVQVIARLRETCPPDTLTDSLVERLTH